jgi:competence protein ComEC
MWYRLILFVLLVCGIYVWFGGPAKDELRMVFCDVGQGDATLLVRGDFQMLMDTGPNWEKLSGCLSNEIPVWDRVIELVVISHDQKDHSGSLSELRQAYQIGKEVIGLKENVRLRYEDMYFDIFTEPELWRRFEDGENVDVNELSLVLQVNWRDFRALITGDIGFERELALVADGVLEKIDVLKVAHHGSKFSSADSFLQVVEPALAVISVGAKNSYGHPTGEVLTRLDIVGAKVMRTDEMGTIRLKTDGERIWWR